MTGPHTHHLGVGLHIHLKTERKLEFHAGILHDSHALKDVEAKRAIMDVGSKINASLETGIDAPWCQLTTYGKEWGSHTLCNVGSYILPHHDNGCAFWSFGISHDASFDADMISQHGCYGLAFDPSISEASNFLGDHSVFLAVGANLLDSSAYQPGRWHLVNVPVLARALSVEKLHALKMDCEGCEYALAYDILESDKEFFYKVDQFAVEVHISSLLASTMEHIHGLGMLYHMLHAAGLQLVHVNLTPCGSEHKEHASFFDEIGYPTGSEQNCQNLLFAKRPL